jgi:hypothetical protein
MIFTDSLFELRRANVISSAPIATPVTSAHKLRLVILPL